MPLKPTASGRFTLALVNERTDEVVAKESFFRGSDRKRTEARDAMLRALASKPMRDRLRRTRAQEAPIRKLLADATLRAGLQGRSGHKRFRITA